MCRMGRWWFWFWFDVNRSTFDEGMCEKRLLHYFRCQRPWPLTFIPEKFAPLVTLVHGHVTHVSSELEVSTSFLFRENRRHGTNSRTDGRVQRFAWSHGIMNVPTQNRMTPLRALFKYTVSQKIPPCGLLFVFLTFFQKRLRILNQIFTSLLYARVHIFIQLSPTVTKLCHIKRDYLVHIMCSECPPSAETRTFRRLQSRW